MKKTLAVLLAALFCAVWVLGCGQSGNTPAKESTAASSETQTEGTKATETTKETEAETTVETSKEEDTSESEVDPKDVYKARFILCVVNDNWPHQDLVNEHVAEISRRDLKDVEIEIVPLSFSAMLNQIPLMMAANEQIDVYWSSATDDHYEQGYCVDLMQYKDILQPAITLLGEEDIMASRHQGRLLCLPPQTERTHSVGMAMRTDILKECGFDPETINGAGVDAAFEKAEEIYKAVHEKYPDMRVIAGKKATALPCFTYSADSLGDGYGVLDNYGETFDVVNLYETEFYKKAVSYMKKWFDLGYVQRDLAVSEDNYESQVKSGAAFGGFGPMKPDSDAEKRDQCAHEMTIFHFTKEMLGAYGGGSGYTIGGTSKDYEKAAKALNYCFTSGEFNDTINWGVEGEDWVEIAENVAAYPEGMNNENRTYHNAYGWLYPNQRVGHVWEGNRANIYTEIYPEAEKNAIRSCAYGFLFDKTDYLDTIGALNNIKDEYNSMIGSGGIDDVDGKIKEFCDRLYGSGLQTVMDAKQEQLNAWREANGK